MRKLIALHMKQKLLFVFRIFLFSPLNCLSIMIIRLKSKFSLGDKVIVVTGVARIPAHSFVQAQTDDGSIAAIWEEMKRTM